MYSPQNPNAEAFEADVARRNLIRSLAVGIATAVAFGLGGFYFIYDRTGAMGPVLFLLLPFATGFATGLVATRINLLITSLVVAFLVCTTVLVVMGLEGWVCVLMSLPLLAVGLLIGAVAGVLLRKLFDRSSRPTTFSLIVLLVLPPFLIGANNVEEPARRTRRTETFSSVLVIAAPADQVWNSIKTMDRVNGRKGFLMRIGLPVPISCSVDREEVGGTRSCYFESGFIQERITEWKPPYVMKLKVTNWDVPGRPWLDFEDASYEFREENGNTIMTRTTTIASRLLPAWYWRRFERIGVETEHEFLFEAIRNRIREENR